MWLSILILVALVGGLALALGGVGILGFPLLLVALGAVGVLVAQRAAGANSRSGGRTPSTNDDPSTPQDTGHSARHVKTGAAHPGQERMVP